MFNLKRVLPVLYLLLIAGFADVMVVNSRDWADVYAAMLYASYNKLNIFYPTSTNPASLFNILPKDNILLYTVTGKELVPNLEAQLRARGYNVKAKVELRNAQLELIPSFVERFYVIERDQPELSVVVAPLAILKKAWVFVVDDENIDSVAERLKGAREVVLVGSFKRSIYEKLKPYASKEINDPSKFKLAIKIAEEFLKEKKVKSVLVTDALGLEPEFFKANVPVLLVGRNLLPDEVYDFLIRNDIESVTLVGMHLTYVGEQIRSRSNKKIKVIVKFGVATPRVSGTIYALSFFPLPKAEPKLELSWVKLDPKSFTLYIAFKNPGDIGVYELSSFSIIDEEGNELASGGDKEPVFIGAGEELVRSYKLNPIDVTKKLYLQLYTSFGSSAEALEKFLTPKDKFSPPLVVEIKKEAVPDNAQLEVLGIKYYPNYKRIGVKLKNIGSTNAVAVVKLINIKVGGIRKSLSSEKVELKPDEEKEVFIPAELDEIDLQENNKVLVEVDYGEVSLIKSLSKSLELEVSKISLNLDVKLVIGVALIAGVALLIFLASRSGPI